MTTPNIDLKQYFIRFVVMILNLLTSRKFWLTAAAVSGSFNLYAAGEITAVQFQAAAVSSLVALMLTIVAEDIAIKLGSAKIVSTEVAVTGRTREEQANPVAVVGSSNEE